MALRDRTASAIMQQEARASDQRRPRAHLLHGIACLFPIALLTGLATAESPKQSTILIETDKGEIEISLDLARAPATVMNFLRYVDSGLLDGTSFYRSVRSDNQPSDPIKIAVIQGGLGDTEQSKAFGPIGIEKTSESGIRHLDGTISMARLGPDTATAEFFICVGDQPELDEGGRRNPDGYGFAAFGRVTRGMDVVRAIHESPADEQILAPPIRISRVRRQEP